MTERMTVAEFHASRLKRAKKYRNQPTYMDGQRFDSKLEADRYYSLKNYWSLGMIRWFTRQVPFRLPGDITYRADFLVVWARLKDPVSVEDCKGVMTQVSLNKIKQVEEIYGFKVDIITRSKGTKNGRKTQGKKTAASQA